MVLNKTHKTEESFAQQFSLQKGLKKFKERGIAASTKEMKQQHDQICFQLCNVSGLSDQEKKRAQAASAHLTEKQDGTFEARMVHNGELTHEWSG